MKAHTFGEKSALGRKGEDFIIQYLSPTWIASRPSLEEDIGGIDLIGVSRYFRGDLTKTWQVKTDDRAHETGNVFVETIGNDVEDRPGWIHTCTKPGAAGEILYLIWDTKEVFHVNPHRLQELALRRWVHEYPERRVPNKTLNQRYNTVGVLVPLSVFAEICHIRPIAPASRSVAEQSTQASLF